MTKQVTTLNLTKKLIKLTKEKRIEAFAQLGTLLGGDNALLDSAKERAVQHNSWFTRTHVDRAVKSMADLLTVDQLTDWLAPYPFHEPIDRTVGLVCAGNIPMVGFHDMLAILIAGFNLQVKFSSDDQVLNRFALDQLIEIEPAFRERIREVDRLQNFDLVIATGSDNTARYFDYYFQRYPHIIRRNRHGVGVLDGTETPEQLHRLGDDLFTYFGLGCRNVSKLYVPKDYDVATFFEGIADYQQVLDHHKYRNNYDFHKSIYLINGDTHFDNGFLLLKPDTRLASPLGALFYEPYDTPETVTEALVAARDTIQCVVSDAAFILSAAQSKDGLPPVWPLGTSQSPGLQDYADGINTLEFLAKYYS